VFERFTDRARKAMQLANTFAQRMDHDFLGTEHILVGIMKVETSIAATVLENLNVSKDSIVARINTLLAGSERGSSTMPKLPMTPRGKRIIEYSMEEARTTGCNYVGTEHMLLGCLREGEGIAHTVLMEHGLTLERVRAEVLKVISKTKPVDNADMTVKQLVILTTRFRLIQAQMHQSLAEMDVVMEEMIGLIPEDRLAAFNLNVELKVRADQPPPKEETHEPKA
jgi:ATP-dependent Clp protease ATP-binding subunit ClpA